MGGLIAVAPAWPSAPKRRGALPPSWGLGPTADGSVPGAAPGALDWRRLRQQRGLARIHPVALARDFFHCHCHVQRQGGQSRGAGGGQTEAAELSSWRAPLLPEGVPVPPWAARWPSLSEEAQLVAAALAQGVAAAGSHGNPGSSCPALRP